MSLSDFQVCAKQAGADNALEPFFASLFRNPSKRRGGGWEVGGVLGLSVSPTSVTPLFFGGERPVLTGPSLEPLSWKSLVHN